MPLRGLAPLARSVPAPRSPGRRRSGARALGLSAVAASALATALLAPAALLAHGTARARACLASIGAPRGPALPDCRLEIHWFVTPSRVPWTATSARYRGEELSMRAAVAAYDDAAIGVPDAAALERGADGLASAAHVIHDGSQRVTLEELGRAVGAPDPGRSAMLAGDRRTLIARADQWEAWPVRLRALEAALIEGDLASAAAIARRYAEFDPRDEDVRVAVAAMLCHEGDAARGGELLATVEAERARDRHESWARNWGDARAVALACAGKAGRPAPPPPARSNAGEDDQLEARAALAVSFAARAAEGGARDTSDDPTLRIAAYELIQLMKGRLLPSGFRVQLLAVLLGSGYAVAPALAAELSTPRTADGEGPLLRPLRALAALEWLDTPRGVRPWAPRTLLRHAADWLRRSSESTEIAAEERLALETAATATFLDAARAFAVANDPAGAIEILDRAGARALPNAGARAFARSSAWYVAADPVRALAEVEREPADLHDDAGLEVAWWIQKAELLAVVGRRDEAARAAVLADEAAALLGDRGLEVRALWTRLALARPPLAALGAAPPASLPGDRAWPWVGEIATASSWLQPGAESGPALAQALAYWDAARRAPPEERRAIRYAAARAHRGDAPRALAAYLALGAELLPRGEGDVEVWLDAFSATTARKVTLRTYAWSRAMAARLRGDADAASRWTDRYRTLARFAAGPDDGTLAAALGI